MKFNPRDTCGMCNAGTIVQMRVYQTSKSVAAIGYILLALSSIGLLAAVVGYVNSLKPAEGNFRTLKEFVAIFEQVGAVSIAFFSLVGGFVGFLLIRKKDVLKCNQCGVEVPRSLSAMNDR